jgi:hypothetical protein
MKLEMSGGGDYRPPPVAMNSNLFKLLDPLYAPGSPGTLKLQDLRAKALERGLAQADFPHVLFGEAEQSGYVWLSVTQLRDDTSIALVHLTEEGAAAYEDYERQPGGLRGGSITSRARLDPKDGPSRSEKDCRPASRVPGARQ